MDKQHFEHKKGLQLVEETSPAFQAADLELGLPGEWHPESGRAAILFTDPDDIVRYSELSKKAREKVEQLRNIPFQS